MDLLKEFISISENFGIVSDFDLFNLDDPLNFKVLSLKESEICSRFTSSKRKHEFIAGRLACKKAFFKLISETTDCLEKFSSVSVLNTETGSPFIENSHLCVSISHSHGIAVASIDHNSIGVDIEQINPKRISALKRISAEYPSEDIHLLTALWTLKESLGKALRTGIIKEFSFYKTKNFQFKNGIYHCNFENFPFSGIAISNNKYSLGIVKDRRIAIAS